MEHGSFMVHYCDSAVNVIDQVPLPQTPHVSMENGIKLTAAIMSRYFCDFFISAAAASGSAAMLLVN